MPAVTIAAQFNGPPGTANGGYACGVLAEGLPAAEAVSVALRAPLPLERELTVAGGRLLDGETVLAEASATTLTLDVPPPPPLEEARAAHLAPDFPHPFPCCFVCGPDRAAGDGLRILPGPVAPGVVATTWTPLSADRRILWSALDCPSSFACTFASRAVLANLTAQVHQEPQPGRELTVLGWHIASDGRKHHAGTALYDGTALLAAALALWIELRH